MAFDLEYVLVPCNHRLVDDTIQLATTAGKILIEDGPVFGSMYMGDTYMGNDLYVYKTNVSPNGTVQTNTDGTQTGIFQLTYRMANSPRLFRKKPWDYQREEITPETYTEWTTAVRYGRGHRFGTKPFPLAVPPASLPAVRYAGPAPAFAVNPQAQWYVQPIYDAENNFLYNNVIIKRYDPTFTYILDYTVEKEECPHCLSTGIKNDLVWGATGKLKQALNTKKLVQQVMKSILTYKGKNYYFPEYGTMIKELLGTKNMFLGFLIRSEIMTQLQRIKNFHDNGIKTNPGLYGPYETLNDLIGVEIYPTSDPRAIQLKAILQTNMLERLDTQVIRIS